MAVAVSPLPARWLALHPAWLLGQLLWSRGGRRHLVGTASQAVWNCLGADIARCSTPTSLGRRSQSDSRVDSPRSTDDTAHSELLSLQRQRSVRANAPATCRWKQKRFNMIILRTTTTTIYDVLFQFWIDRTTENPNASWLWISTCRHTMVKHVTLNLTFDLVTSGQCVQWHVLLIKMCIL